MYESLMQSEFVAGYLAIMEEDLPNTPDTKKVLQHINYLRRLMEDCFEVEWPTVWTAHKQVLNAIDHGRLRWADFRACLDTKSTALQQVLRINAQGRNVKTSEVDKGTTPCPLYQSSNCQFAVDHSSDGTLYAHCCAYCFRSGGQRYWTPRGNLQEATGDVD